MDSLPAPPPEDDVSTLARLVIDAGFPAPAPEHLARIRAQVDALAERAFGGYRPGLDVFALAVQGGPGKAADPTGWPDGVRWLDLVLIDGFRHGHLDATAALVDGIMGMARGHLERLGASAELAADLVQERLARLLGPRERIGYGGRGPLGAWVRRCLSRDLLAVRRRADVEGRIRERHALEDGLVRAVSFPELPAREDALRAAIAEAVSRLEPELRRLLRYIHLDGLTAAQAGALLGLHRVSVQRRLAEARLAIRSATRATLQRRHGIAKADVSSLVRTLLGGFDLTVSQLLHSR